MLPSLQQLLLLLLLLTVGVGVVCKQQHRLTASYCVWIS
jgi:hypothetical protein